MEENGNIDELDHDQAGAAEAGSGAVTPVGNGASPRDSGSGNGYLNHTTVPKCPSLLGHRLPREPLTIEIPSGSGSSSSPSGGTNPSSKRPLQDDDVSDDSVSDGDDNSSCSSFDDECPSSPRKRRRLDLQLSVQPQHLEPKEIERLGNLWKSASSNGIDAADDAGANETQNQISNEPFLHCQLENFLTPDEVLYSLIKAIGSEITFGTKCSDLFQFRQSDDLKSIVDVPEVNKIRELFETKVFDIVQKISGFPLNGRVDMFLSDYQEADHLLCHDDELEDRRIAFILYLNSDWKPEYGGTLDLFQSSPDIEPTTISKSISPTYNRFVFFDVHCRSFHQVSEITEPGVSRLALSGWFYGEPIPRPQIKLPETTKYLLQEHVATTSTPATNSGDSEDSSYSIESNLEDVYSDLENQKVFNKQLEEESEAMLMEFFQPQILKDLLQEASSPTANWLKKGPVNLCNYWIHEFQLPTIGIEPPISTSTISLPNVISPLQKMVNFFHSKPFLGFLETILEMPFTSEAPIFVHSELRKFEHKNYTLLKSENSEIEIQKKNRAMRKATKAVPVVSKPEADEVPAEVDDNEVEEDDEQVENCMEDEEEEAEDNEIVGGNEDEMDDDDEEGNLVDLIYYFGDFEDWDELNGGQTIYIDGNGEQVMSINPSPNSLAVVVRTKSVNSYVSYVNYMSQNSSFYAYTMTFQLSETDLLRPLSPSPIPIQL